MELRHLRYFIRAAEMLHFTRAAESLYISQPSLSVHMQQLEDELKTKLFDRVGRQVRLTDAGHVLLVRAHRIVLELEAAEREIENITGHLRGPLTLGTLPMYGSKALPPWIDAFNEQHPNVRIRVRAMRAEEVESSLIAGTIDLGFSLGPPEHSQLHSQQLVDDQIVLAVAPDHPLAKKTVIQPKDFEGLPLALPSQNISSTRAIGSFFEAINIVPNIATEQDDGNALMELARLGNFATLLPESVISRFEGVVLVKLPEPGVPIDVSAMWLQLTPTAQAFLDLVINTVAKAKAAKTGEDDGAGEKLRNKTKSK